MRSDRCSAQAPWTATARLWQLLNGVYSPVFLQCGNYNVLHVIYPATSRLSISMSSHSLTLISTPANQRRKPTSHHVQGHEAAASSDIRVSHIFIAAGAYRLAAVLPDEPGASILRTCGSDFGYVRPV